MIDMNPAAERILGKSREEFLAAVPARRSLAQCAMTARRSREGTSGDGGFADGQPVRGVVMGVFNPRRKERRWISVDAVPIIRADEEHPNQVYTVFADITERKQAEEGLQEADLKAMTRLQQIGAMFAQEGNLEPVLGAVVDAAIAISGADFGNVQLLDPKAGVLQIAAQRGFPRWWVDFWNNVTKGQGVCGAALERGERYIVEDVEQSPIFAGTPALDVQRRACVRAVQSTPLVTRSGKALGIFSTHYKSPHGPDERALRLLDLLARQAADMIERAQTEEALRKSERCTAAIGESIDYGVWVCAPDGRNTYASESSSRWSA